MVSRYVVYWARMIRCAFSGGRVFWTWMSGLLVLMLAGAAAYAYQLQEGLIVTNLTDHVSWGFYLANFVYFVGVAAAAAILVVPAYVYHRQDIKEVVIIGEILALVAIVMCMLFIMTDVGRPDRLWHLMPPVGRMNLPTSLLAWDVIVVSGYLLLNMHIPGYLLYKRYKGETPSPLYYLPLVFLSAAWAVSIHTVTAFLLSGLGSRPFWNSPILAPRFLISAGASGPALLIIVLALVRRHTDLKVKESVFDYLKQVLRITMPINLFLLGCELFYEFYTGSLHAASARYLYFGLHGHNTLTWFIWSALLANTFATVVFVSPTLRRRTNLFMAACVLTILGIWTEKGMGLIVPGFIPNPVGQIVEYLPSLREILLSLGVLSLGAFVFTAMVKVIVAIQTGALRLEQRPAPWLDKPPELANAYRRPGDPVYQRRRPS
jgi:Ni/Fe-hydrogenase subunit HybB-like protein